MKQEGFAVSQKSRRRVGAHLCLLVAGLGVGTHQAAAQNSSGATPTTVRGHGIELREAKVFDHRSLARMLAGMEGQLRGVNVFNQDSLVAALGKFQGARGDRSNLNFQATTLPTPKVTDTISDLGGKDQKTQRVIDQAALTPAVPALSSPAASFTATPAFGTSAVDLFGEQAALTYQIVNMRLLLERALSDRFSLSIPGPDSKSGLRFEERLQALLGFSVSVDAPKQYKDALAEVVVEVSMAEELPVLEAQSLTGSVVELKDTKGNARSAAIYRPTADAPDDLSVVALYPASKTYNVATASSKTTGFGFGAILQPLSIGVSSSRTRDDLYLVRDVDTVALEKTPRELAEKTPRGPAEKFKGVRFAWQFRPVLGRRTVEPGIRQVFAALALPPMAYQPAKEPGSAPITSLKVKIYTGWRKYDKNKGTVGELIDGKYEEQSLNSVPVLDPQLRERILQPELTRIDWSEVGGGEALVQIEGQRLAEGTGVLVGETAVGAEQGFTIQGERRMQFLVPLTDLATKPLYLNGHEGPVRSIEYAFTGAEDLIPGIRIEKVTPMPTDADFPGGAKDVAGVDRLVKVTIRRRNKPDVPSTPWFAKFGSTSARSGDRLDPHVLVVYGGRVFNTNSTPVTLTGKPTDPTATLTFRAPVEVVRQARTLEIVTPFAGERYADVFRIEASDEFTAPRAIVLTQAPTGTTYGIFGTNFRNDVTVTVGNGNSFKPGDTVGPKDPMKPDVPRLVRVDPTFLRLFLEPQETKGLKHVVVRQGTVSVPVALPVAEPPAVPEPNITTIPKAFVGDEEEVVLEGTNFTSVDKVSYLGQELKFKASADGKKLTLLATKELKELRATPGNRPLLLQLKDGVEVPFKLAVEMKK